MSQFIFPPLVASLDSEASSGAALPSAQVIVGGFFSGTSVVYPLAVDASGQLQVDVVSSTGPTGFATSALQTTGNGILTTINTSLDNIEADVDTSAGAVSAIQSAQGTTDTGIPALVVRNDTLADLSGADGDYAPIQVNADGAVYTVLSAGTATFGTVNVGTVSGTVTVTGTALKLGTANAGVNIGTVALSTSTGVDIGAVTLLSGTQAIGSVTIGTSTGVDIGNVGLKAGSNNIGDVDVLTMPDVTVDTYTVVDQIDSTVTGVTNNVYVLSGTNTIPASTGTAMTLVAASAAAIKKIQTVEDIGEFMGIWYGSSTSTAGTATFGCILPLGGGEVPLEIPITYKIYLKALTSGTAITSGSLGINFLG